MPKTKQPEADRKNYINTRVNDYIYERYLTPMGDPTPGLERVRWGDPKKGMPPAEKKGKPIRYVHDRDTVTQRFKSRKV